MLMPRGGIFYSDSSNDLTRRLNFKSEFGVKYKTKEFCFLDYFYRHFSQKDVWVWGGKKILLVKGDADCLGGGELKSHSQTPTLGRC